MPATHPTPRQRFVIVTYNPDEALEVTGVPCGWSVEWSTWREHEMVLRIPVSNPLVRTIKTPSFTLWERTWQWLKDCPLRRQPHDVAYPLL